MVRAGHDSFIRDPRTDPIRLSCPLIDDASGMAADIIREKTPSHKAMEILRRMPGR
jgi:hypothetical protein